MTASKLSSLSTAISKWVPDGASLVMCTCLESMIPFAAGHEIIRQQKRGLVLIGPISDILFDQLVGGGCVRKIKAAWVGNVITGSAYRFRHAVEKGAIQMEDHSNLTIAMALKAAALGTTFIPVKTALGSDLPQSNPHLAKMRCPFSQKPLLAVKAIFPDVAVVHVQRSDEFGNAHAWGNLGVTKDALMASRRIILTVEEVVTAQCIRSDPNRVLIPGFRVDAVVHVPWGAHPSPVPGYYNRDHQAYIDYRNSSRSQSDFDTWRRRWIDAVRRPDDHAALIGSRRMADLGLRRHDWSERVDYGY